MVAAKLRHAFLYVLVVVLLLGRPTLSVAQPSVVSALEGAKSNASKQARVISIDEGSQYLAKTQPILLAQNSSVSRAPVPSEIIGEISVEGSQRVDPTTVISYMKLKVGERFEREKLDESLKSLFSTGYFRDVKFRREGSILVVQVQENPVVNRIAFEGNDRIKDEVLQAELKLKPRLVYTANKIQSDAERIIDVYRKSGRFAVNVEPKLIELDQNRVDIVFEIQEGDLTKVHKIVFIGNQRFSDRQLRSVISTDESRWYRFFSSNDIYDPDRLSYDKELLRKYYLRNGYVDFQVINSVAELTSNKDGFIITITLEEGERYEIASIGIDSKIQGADINSLQKAVKSSVGDHYNVERIDETVDDLTDMLGRAGVSFFKVSPKVMRRENDRSVDVVFEIDYAEKVYVERINIVGNLRTLDSVIRREMRFAEGDEFNRAKLRESERRLRRLGFFQSIKIETVPTEKPDRIQLEVNVVEQSTGELSFGAGLSSDNGVLGNASLTERNLLGKGQELSLSFGVSVKDTQVNLSFTEPYFLDRPLSAGIDIFSSDRDLSDESAYTEKVVGFGLRTGFEPAPRWRQVWSYSLKDSEISASSGASRFIVAQNGLSTTSKISQKLSYDNTDNFFDPSEGLRLSWNIEVAGLGGSVAYINNEAKASQFFPLPSETVLQLSARGGAIFGLGQDIKLSDRYFLSSTTFRGFANSGVGARDSSTSDALGGNYYYLSSAELAFPLGASKELGLRGRAFVDAGSVFHTDDTGTGINNSSNPRVSVGVGLTWASALGPLRLDFGYAVMKEDFDQDQVFSFTFGTRF
jgi:outer membrane protein insertion porin family